VTTSQATVGSATGAANLDDVLAELAVRRQEFGEQKYVPRDFVARLKETGVYRPAPLRR
jgi:hypothetical protein